MQRTLTGFLLALLAGCATPDRPLTGGVGASAPLASHAVRAASPDAGFNRLLDSVVRIDVREATFENGQRQIIRGVGSGVIMSPEGYVLTNAHVVSPQAEEIRVTLANLERVDATLVGWDHWTDLAVLKLDTADLERRRLSIQHAEFGDSTAAYPGQTVFAVGTPNGLTRTVTRGIISNANRFFSGQNQIRGYETGYFNTWLQTDAAINPGNSGGPLVDENGRVLGINTRSYLGAENLSFAVPAAIAQEVMAGLLENGRIVRSYIGIRPAPLQDLEDFYGLNANVGMLVESVDPGSPASLAGFRPGDIVLTLDGRPVDGRFPEQLPPILNTIAHYPVGATLNFTVRRAGQEQLLPVRTELLESRVGEQAAFEEWGLSVQEVSRTIAREQSFSSDEGVFVVGLVRAFPGEKAGLNRGDVIRSANRQPVRGLQDLQDVYARFAEGPEPVLLEVVRNHQVSFLVLKPQP